MRHHVNAKKLKRGDEGRDGGFSRAETPRLGRGNPGDEGKIDVKNKEADCNNAAVGAEVVQAGVTRDEAKLERQRRHERAFLDVLHVMAGAGFVAKEYLVVLRLNQRTWNDPRLWAPLVNVKYKYTTRVEKFQREEARLVRECREGRETSVLRLLRLRADVSVENNLGATALVLAGEYGRINLVHAFIDRDGDQCASR